MWCSYTWVSGRSHSCLALCQHSRELGYPTASLLIHPLKVYFELVFQLQSTWGLGEGRSAWQTCLSGSQNLLFRTSCQAQTPYVTATLFLPSDGCELRAFTGNSYENAHGVSFLFSVRSDSSPPCSQQRDPRCGPLPLPDGRQRGGSDLGEYQAGAGVWPQREPWKLLMPQGHEERGIAWQLHSKADRLLLSSSPPRQLHKHLPTQT